MKAILEDETVTGEIKEEFRFGTYKFNTVWEKLIEDEYSTDEKSEYNPPAEWKFFNNKTKPASKMRPDTIMIQDEEVFVLDAKYYSVGIVDENIGVDEKGSKKDQSTKTNLPTANDINKQIRYGEYAANKKDSNPTYNAYLLPYDLKSLKNLLKDNDYKEHSPETAENYLNYFCIGYAYIKGDNSDKPHNKVLGILVDTKWLMENYGNADKEELAKFVKRQYTKCTDSSENTGAAQPAD